MMKLPGQATWILAKSWTIQFTNLTDFPIANHNLNYILANIDLIKISNGNTRTIYMKKYEIKFIQLE